MEYRMLGNTGIRVSRLCFGTLVMGPVQAALPVGEGGALLAYAMQRGVNFCDTAQLYETYPYIKEAMRLSGNHELVISTKTYAYTRALARQAVDQALRELGRDYIDIFMLHEQESIHTLRGHAEALEYFYECKERGVIRAVGASMHTVAAVEGSIQRGLDVVFPLINVNGLGIADGSRADMEHAASAAHSAGIGVMGMKVFGGGNLHRTPERCLDYALGLPFLDSIAIGMQSRDEVDYNVAFFERAVPPPALRDRLAAKERHLHIDDWCEGCGACVRRCGQGALTLRDGKAVCDRSRCVLCGYCSTVCPQWCIKMV